MAQVNLNPNGTANTNEYWVDGGTLSATPAGLRWAYTGTGTVHLQWWSAGGLPTGVFTTHGWKVRRNTGSSKGLVSVTSSFGAAKYKTTSLLGGSLPSGVFIAMPHLTTNSRASGDADLLYNVAATGPFDLTFTNLYVYTPGSVPAESVVIEAGDAAFTVSTPTNSLTAAVTHSPNNEWVDALSWAWGHGPPTAGGANIQAQSGITSRHSVAHAFPGPGTYNVTLTASNYAGQSASTTKAVTVPSGTFTANYTWQTSYLDLEVDGGASTYPSLDPPDAYTWDWGDGTPTSTGIIATHTYAAPGVYPVTLTITTAETLRTSSETKALTIVAPPAPDNYFVPLRDLLSVEFHPSITDGTSYAWDFGDGNSSTDRVPTHTYGEPGTYAVTLTIDALDPVTQSIVVYDTYRPLRDLSEALRLEVAVPHPSGTIYNRLPNPSGELGSWGWLTPVSDSYLTGQTTSDGADDHGIVGAKLVYHASGAGVQSFTSDPVRATPGDYASAQVVCPYIEGYYRMKVDALDAAGAVLGSSALTGYQQAGASVVRTTPYLLPASTATARVVIYHYLNTSAGTPAAGDVAQFRRVMLAYADTSGELTSNPYTEGSAWQDLLGPTHEIAVEREALNVGTLAATILDSTYDPATSGVIRPGQGCRLRAQVEDAGGNVQWSPIFTGTVSVADVAYAKTPAEVGKTRITLRATDAATTLTQRRQPAGVATLQELPHVLEGIGVPYEVNGSSGQVPAANVVNYNPNASVLDQVAITRDTDGGYAYVSRAGVLVAVDPEHMPTVPSGVVDESVYSSVDATFSTGDLINSVIIKWLRYTPASGDPEAEDYAEAKVEEIPYGPYEDADSIEEWGVQSATFTMCGLENPTNIEAKAVAILAANGTPRRRVTGVRAPIRWREDLHVGKALLDLYDLVQLGYARTGTDEPARVTGIKHAITPRKWMVELAFSDDGTVAAPQLVAQPPVSIPAPDAEEVDAPRDAAWTASGSASSRRITDGVYLLSVRGVVRTSALTPNATTGDVTDETVLTVDAAHKPAGTRYGQLTSNGVHIALVAVTNTGALRLLGFPSKPSAAFTPNMSGDFIYTG